MIRLMLSGARVGFWKVFKAALRGNVCSFGHAAIMGYQSAKSDEWREQIRKGE